MNRIAIIGSGLIGTSLGLALRRSPDRFEVTAWDSSQNALAVCEARGGCNRSASSLRDAVRDADVVVLAAPLDAILVLMQELTTHLNPSTVVTDVAGVKVPPVETARLLLPGRFVGGHPMAGAATAGPESARADLFDGAAWAVCPVAETPLEVVEPIEALARAVGATPVTMTAAVHDAAVSWVSHVPQLLALELLAGLDDRGGLASAVGRLAAGGFRDLTRIGASPASIWLPVLHANRHQIARDVLELSDRLRDLADDLSAGTPLAPRFHRANALKRLL